MKKLRLLPFVFCLALAACGNDHSSSESKDSLPKDSVPALATALQLGGDTLEPADANAVLYRFDEKMIGDTGRIAPLSVEEVRKRFWPVPENCDQEAAYMVRQLFYLDSMNAKGDHSYEEPGATVSVQIREIEKLQVNPGINAVAWAISFSSYAACPFSTGTYYMLSTYDKSGKNIATMMMGDRMSAGDPPSMFSGSTVCNLYRDGSYKSLQVDTTEDLDAPEKDRYEIHRSVFRGTIGNDGSISREEVKAKE